VGKLTKVNYPATLGLGWWQTVAETCAVAGSGGPNMAVLQIIQRSFGGQIAAGLL